jgi:hypothetical protein
VWAVTVEGVSERRPEKVTIDSLVEKYMLKSTVYRCNLLVDVCPKARRIGSESEKMH